MKYCSKCGNELFDEAIICPKCGCPVSDSGDSVSKTIRNTKLQSASALNFISFIFHAAIAIYLCYMLFGDPYGPATPLEPGNIYIGFEGDEPRIGWFFIWIIGIICTFILGLMISKKFKTKTDSRLAYGYLFLSILNLLFINLAIPNLVYLVACIIGVIFYIPNILQILAGIRFIQSAK
jgi:hypothetical protein